MNSDKAYNLTYRTGISNIELEEIISKDFAYSYFYAIHVLKGRFELVEEAISKDSYYSYFYALYAIKGRFELGELAMSESGYYSLYYARDVLKGRFELGESEIGVDSNSLTYFYEVLGYDHE